MHTKPWKIIIADDDAEVHNVTKMILGNYIFEGRPFELISAYSGAETKKLISSNPDTAIILLDVMMETDDAGLKVVRYIRKELKNAFVRIILRTGKATMVPESDVMIDYEINGYRKKTELTVQKLYMTIISALRSYRDLRTLDNRRYGLEQVNKAFHYCPK
jgi:CheY-like chemotaxis protein